MRVSDSMIYQRAQVQGGAARSRLDEATARASSGLRVVHPGDDPAAAGLVTAERMRMQRLDALASSTGRASDEIAAADGALDAVNNALEIANNVGLKVLECVALHEGKPISFLPNMRGTLAVFRLRK